MQSSVNTEIVYAENPYELENRIEGIRVSKLKYALNTNQRFEVTDIKKTLLPGDCEAEITYTLRWSDKE